MNDQESKNHAVSPSRSVDWGLEGTMYDFKHLELRYVDPEITHLFNDMDIEEYPFGFPRNL